VTNAFLPLPFDKDGPYIGTLEIETLTPQNKPNVE
jgi:hypothetical protein